MTPEDELAVLSMVESLNQAGVEACIIWPHEELLAVTPTEVSVYDSHTGTIVSKPRP